MNRHVLSVMMALLLAAMLLFGGTACAQTYASLVEKLGKEAALCETCGEEAKLEIEEYYHYVICQNEACSEYNCSWGYYHYASCVDASVCGVCGAPSQSSYTEHVYAGMPYFTSEAYHWQACALCGDEEESSWYRHSCSCQEDVCEACGIAVNIRFDIEHSISGEYKYDAERHWMICDECGEVCEEGEHWGNCEDKTCYDCNVVIADPDRMGHSWDFDQVLPNLDEPNMHGYECQNCGYIGKYGEHEASCKNPGICKDCGAECDVDYVQHNYDYDQAVLNPADPRYHGYACVDCGKVRGDDEHYAYCEAPDTCYECGAQEYIEYVYHDVDYDQAVALEDKPGYHGYLCVREGGCGEYVNAQEHYAYCSDPDTCYECGAAYEGEADHEYGEMMVPLPDNPDRHGWPCIFEGCGYVSDVGEHWQHCANPGVCEDCGAAYTGSNVSHYINYNEYVPCPDNEAYHGHPCRTEGCGYVEKDSIHRQACDNPGVCVDCGAACSGTNWSHTPGDDYGTNENCHWEECTVCGTYFDMEIHRIRCQYSLTECYDCGYEIGETSMVEYSHAWSDRYDSNETYHWNSCRICDEVLGKSRHVRSCSDPGVCMECGVACEKGEIEHDVNWNDPIITDKTHSYVCLDCGEEVYSDRHYADCDDLNHCADCGAETTNFSYIGHWYGDYIGDEIGHWVECTHCGEIVDEGRHNATCYNPGVCEICGYEDEDMEIDHLFNYSENGLRYDETYHWNVCAFCGEKESESRHHASCIAPGVCDECGADYDGTRVSHSYDWDNYFSDANKHWNICDDCGEKVNESKHSAACNAPGVCDECGADYTGTRVSHNVDWDNYYNDANKHWQICEDCEAIVEQETHWAFCDVPGVCVNCGYEDENIRTSHYYDESDYLFDAEHHWNPCEGCGYALEKEPHRRLCDGSSNTCMDCGAAYSGNVFAHEPGSEYDHDSYNHWLKCSLCGGVTEKDEHDVSCLDPDVCQECGAEAITWNEDDLHRGSDYYEYDAYMHWEICEDCGEGMYYSTHWADCANPGVCEMCGYESEEMELNHWTGDIIEINSRLHTVYCISCNETLYEEEHVVRCGDATLTCEDCGYVGATGYWMDHLGLSDEITARDDGHYRHCTNCNQDVFKDEHEVDCANPGVCYECGAAVSGVEVNHHPVSRMSSDDACHWYACMVCDEKVDLEYHWDYSMPYGRCDWCAAPVGDMPPDIGLDSKTVYITSRNYGNVWEIYGYYTMKDDDEGDVTVSSSDESVLKAEIVQINNDEYVIRVTGLKVGTATLTMTAPNGLTDTMEFKAVAAGNELVLPEDTRSIHAQAFAGASALEFVYIPHYVTEIGDEAFKDCVNLKVVHIPLTVESIGKDAFKGCDDVIIHTAMSSPAYEYALENGISCYGVPQE